MFAERLKQLRKQHNITQEQLAKIIGVERSSIGKYEGKSRIIPSDDVKYKIAQFFGVTVEYLLGHTDIPIETNAADLSKEEYDVILMLRELTESGQELVLDYLRLILSKREYRKEERVESVI